MCEHKDITKHHRTYLVEELVTNFVVNEPCVAREMRVTYYGLLKRRVKTWGILCTRPSLEIFTREYGDIDEPQREKIWKLVQHVHYHIREPKAFFERMMEMAIEEKARFHSFANPVELRAWLSAHLNEHFEDAALMKLYLYIRDGERILYTET